MSTYKGISPFSFDLFVREEGGRIIGTMSAHFIVTGKQDPNVRFDFSGPLSATPSQSFSLQSAEGSKGTIELVPGTVDNLLEMSFKLDAVPGKIRESDVVLVKRIRSLVSVGTVPLNRSSM